MYKNIFGIIYQSPCQQFSRSPADDFGRKNPLTVGWTARVFVGREGGRMAAGVRRGGLSLLGSLAAAGNFPQAVGDESDHHGIEISGRASWH